MPTIKKIRTAIRKQRRSLSRAQQRFASQAACNRLTNHPIFIRSKHIAIYWPNDGEIDPTPLLEKAWRLGKHCYLPVLAPLDKKTLGFSRYRKNQTLRNNRYGIPEPATSHSSLYPAWALDIVITPLVAFDQEGNRIGMGGGYYDRTFHFRAKSPTRKPALIGLGHHFQQIDCIPARAWDVPLTLAATDMSLIEF